MSVETVKNDTDTCLTVNSLHRQRDFRSGLALSWRCSPQLCGVELSRRFTSGAYFAYACLAGNEDTAAPRPMSSRLSFGHTKPGLSSCFPGMLLCRYDAFEDWSLRHWLVGLNAGRTNNDVVDDQNSVLFLQYNR